MTGLLADANIRSVMGAAGKVGAGRITGATGTKGETGAEATAGAAKVSLHRARARLAELLHEEVRDER